MEDDAVGPGHEIGNRFRDLLIRKVGQGVPVRLMVEGAYSQPGLGSKALYRELRDGGVQVVADKTRTVPQVVPSVNAELAPVRDFCESI